MGIRSSEAGRGQVSWPGGGPGVGGRSRRWGVGGPPAPLPTTTSSSTTGTQSRTVAGAGVEPLFFRSQAPLVSAAVLDWVPVVEEEVVVMAALARLT